MFSSSVYASSLKTAITDPEQAFTPQKDWSVGGNQLNGTVMHMCVDVSGNINLLINSSDAYYIEKYNSNGTQIFSEKWNATYSSNSYPISISTDYLNNIFIAGNFYNGTNKYFEPFITKCRPDGSSIWNSSVVGAAGLTEDFYATAIHIGTNNIDLLAFMIETTINGYTIGDFMHISLDTSGNLKSISSAATETVLNSAYSTTFFGDDSMIIANSFPGMTGIANSSMASVDFWNSNGVDKWHNNYIPKNSPATYGVGIDNNSQIYVLGKNYLDSNAVNSDYLYSFNLTNGLPLLWNVTTGTSYPDFSPVLSVLDSNHIYVAGVNVVSAQPIPYLERFNSSGNLIWTTQLRIAPVPNKLITLDTAKFLYCGTYYSNSSNELSLISPSTNSTSMNNSTNSIVNTLFHGNLFGIPKWAFWIGGVGIIIIASAISISHSGKKSSKVKKRRK